MSNEYLQKRMQHILDDRPLPEKKKYSLKPISDKRRKKMEEQKQARSNEPTEKEKWFDERRPELTGRCKCGCGKPSSKNEDEYFRSSIAHVFPQRLFPSIAKHPKNFVERSYWNGCHANMDNRSMEWWPQFEDWNDIKEKFWILAPLLTAQERAKKFYTKFEQLVINN